MKKRRPLLKGFLLFALLGLADLALTYWLLQDGSGHYYEGNPVARWWLHRWGWAGLTLFKGGLVLTAGLTVAAVSPYRPRTARTLLSFGCAVTAAVLVYSCTLLTAREPISLVRVHDEATIVRNARQLAVRLDQVRAYRRVLDAVIADLCAGRCSLAQGVARLAATDKARDPSWREELRRLYPGRTFEQSLKANLLYHATEFGMRCSPDVIPAGL